MHTRARAYRDFLLVLAGSGLAVFATGGAFSRTNPPTEAASAVAASLPLLQASGQIWIEKRDCVSCHHQALGSLAVSLAKERGFPVDEALWSAQLSRMHPGRPADLLVGEGGINGQFGRSYMLAGLAGSGVPRSPATDATAHFLAGKQLPDGRWPSLSHRPPLEDASVTVTALAVRALRAYAPPDRAEDMGRRVARARAWLESVPARTNEERTFRALGLWWAGADAGILRGAVEALARTQRPDGGWSQLTTRESDPYATGQALVALNQAGGLAVSSPVYAAGVEYLLRTRRADGSWRVATRRRSEGLPYFETGFPHGEDQFISYAASAWSTMALTLTVRPGPSAALGAPGAAVAPRAVSPQAPLALAPLHEAAAFGSLGALRARLDTGDDPDARGESGLTALMCAVHDPEKVDLLVSRGAPPDSRTENGHSALLLASGYDGAFESVRVLLDAGADPRARASSGSTPMIEAAASGDPRKVALLLDAGGGLEDGAPDVSPLRVAVWQGDLPTVHYLAARGAAPGSVISSAMDGDAETVRELLRLGADADEPEEDGTTALIWAATIDPGHSEIVEALLAAGANPNARAFDGRTPLDQAEGEGNWHIAERLRRAGARCP